MRDGVPSGVKLADLPPRGDQPPARLDNGTLRGTVCASVQSSDTADTTHTAPFMVGDYEDEYVQETWEWKFQRRTITRAFRIQSRS